MPQWDDANPSCPVCECKDVSARRIESAITPNMTSSSNAADDALHLTCRLCGEFVVTRIDDVNLRSPRLRAGWHSYQLSALLREHHIQKLPPIWLRDGMPEYGPLKFGRQLAIIEREELLQRWPRSVSERIDRTLCNLARLSRTAGADVRCDPTDTSLAFAATPTEVVFHIRALVDYGFVHGQPIDEDTEAIFTLTPSGWARFEELTQGIRSRTNPAFVAMWFGDDDKRDDMNGVFAAIDAAVEKAGYRAMRSDLQEHNDWVMDKIFGDIRVSPFVIADFTHHRNGVYLEAGFARGLGIPVIHTCLRSDFDKAHFDTKQMNHILWDTASDLQTKLFHRIMGTIGEGPFARRGQQS